MQLISKDGRKAILCPGGTGKNPGCGTPSVFQEFGMSTERVCLLSLCCFFLHRHDDVTPSWFRAFESHVLRVPAGNGEIKLWSSPSSLFTPSLLF